PGRPEHVDEAHPLGNLGQGPVNGLTQDHLAVRVDRDDPPAVALHVRGHRVRGLGRRGTRAHHGDRVVGGQDALDDRVGTIHGCQPTRVPRWTTRYGPAGAASTAGSASGSPSTASRSASLPSAIVPVCPARPSASAAVPVAAVSTSAGARPWNTMRWISRPTARLMSLT